MIALISDIHGNYEALIKVFEDIDAHKVDRVFFLGDVVGYGPEPEACIDLLEKHCSVFLMGNHDFAMLNTPVQFNPIAEQAILCMKARMAPGIYSMPRKRKRWKFLSNLKTIHLEDDLLFVHGSPRDPFSEYITPTDPLHNPEKIDSIFDRVERVAFCGHTHYPGLIQQAALFRSPVELENVFRFTKKKAIINVGSVGQPRDGNPSACYLLLDDEHVEWRRVPYDIEATIAKVNEIDCLHARNGERLRFGR